jgi:hypothetical protein
MDAAPIAFLRQAGQAEAGRERERGERLRYDELRHWTGVPGVPDVSARSDQVQEVRVKVVDIDAQGAPEVVCGVRQVLLGIGEQFPAQVPVPGV